MLRHREGRGIIDWQYRHTECMRYGSLKGVLSDDADDLGARPVGGCLQAQHSHGVHAAPDVVAAIDSIGQRIAIRVAKHIAEPIGPADLVFHKLLFRKGPRQDDGRRVGDGHIAGFDPFAIDTAGTDGHQPHGIDSGHGVGVERVLGIVVDDPVVFKIPAPTRGLDRRCIGKLHFQSGVSVQRYTHKVNGIGRLCYRDTEDHSGG